MAALGASVVALLAGLGVVGLVLGGSVVPNEEGMLFSSSMSWFADGTWDVKFMLGMDGLSGLMLLLTVMLFPLLIIYNGDREIKQESLFYGMLMLLEVGILGFFLSMDLMLFYVCFELVLIPTAFLIGIWGGEGRQQAAMKFFLYTLIGSLLMLVGIIYLGIYAKESQGILFTTDYLAIRDALRSGEVAAFNTSALNWVFWGFAISFAIKVPLFPLHTWQAETYSASSTSGSVILAALLSKMGAYGFIRFNLVFFPEISMEMAPLLSGLAVTSILYGAYLAIVQTDIKRLIAFSSLSHLGFIVLGIFAMTEESLSGAILQMFAHGVTTAAMFLLADMLYRRYPSHTIADFQGVAKQAPAFTFLFMITLMASVGLPGLSGFVGEFMILIGAFASDTISHVFSALAALGVILAAVYLLNMFRKVMFGEANVASSESITDVNRREVGIMLPLIIFMFWVGLYATPFLNHIEPASQNTMQEVEMVMDAPKAEQSASR